MIETHLRALARSRLAQFVALGGAIFALAPSVRDPRRIEVSQRELAIARAAEASRHRGERPPDDQIASRLVEDKMLYAEGVRLGLDRDDPIIRQRVVQKVLLLAEDLGGAGGAPSRDDLRAEYARTPDAFRQAPRYHVMHVFAARREDLPAAADLDPVALPNEGEPFPLPRETRATRDELQRSYGDGFGDAVAALAPSNAYSEPVQSSFGWHRVRVVDVAPGRVRPFEEVERRIAFDLTLRRREDTMQRFLAETAARYTVVVDGVTLAGFHPALRLARRDEPSGED